MEIPTPSPEKLQYISTSSDLITADFINPTFSFTCIGTVLPSIYTNLAEYLLYLDLISSRLPSRILSVSDEWFAPASNLTNPKPPIRRPGHFVSTGAWYDGWETRRHNPAPYDWVIIKLGVDAGVVHGVEIDTAFFDGNHAEAVTVQGCFATGEGADEKVIGNKAEDWMNILDKRGCEANRRQAWKVKPSQVVTHVRLCMYPDGGIARFRLYGEVVPEFPGDKGVEVELSALEMGGRCTSCSDEHFGAMGNLVLPGRGMDMGDGWETRRSRGAEHEDWVIVKLGAKGYVDRLVLDTKHFLGNFPKAARVHAIDVGEYGDTYMKSGSDRWVEIMKERGLRPDQEVEVQNKDLINVQGMQYTHIKLTIVPDGGIKRFRVYGRRI